MKTANNPFLATNQQNKTSIVGCVNDSNKTNTTHINRKLRRQTISDPNAYIRYINFNYQQQQHSINNKNNCSLHSKCIPQPCANTLAQSTTTTTTATAAASTSRRTTFNDDKSQKKCQQQQQQLQQISLQFQGITLYDDDVAKSQQIHNNSVNTINGNNKAQQQQQQQQQQQNIIINSWPWYDDKEREQSLEKKVEQTNATAYQILLQQKQQSTKSDAKVKEEEEESNEILANEKCRMIDGKLAQQIIGCNFSKNNNNNNNNNVEKMHTFYVNRNKWMGTYPTTRVKKMMSNFSPITTTTTTFTTTTTATRMTPKIVPSAVIAAQQPSFSTSSSSGNSSSNKKGGYRCLRKHHSFHIQPTKATTPRQDLRMTNDMLYTHHNTLNKQSQVEIIKRQQQQPKNALKEVMEEKEKGVGARVIVGGGVGKGDYIGNEQEQESVGNRYSTWGGRAYGGPLVYRPLTLDEKHAFKPISPRPQNHVSARMSITDAVKINKRLHENPSPKNNYYEGAELAADEEKSLESAEFSNEMQKLNDIVHSDNQTISESKNSNIVKGAALHPAASLEVLEALTHSNPELIYAATQPGSRLNMHTHLSALNQSHSYTATSCGGSVGDVNRDGAVHFKVEQMRAKLQSQLCDGEYNEELSLASQQHKRPKKILYFGDNDFLWTVGNTEQRANNEKISEIDLDFNENEMLEEEEEDEEELDNLNRFSFCESLQNDYEIENNNNDDDINLNTEHNAHNDDNINNNNNNEFKSEFDSTSNSQIILNSSINGGQVKYLVTQNYHEIRI